MSEVPRGRWPRLPWATCLVALAAVVAHVRPGTSAALEFDRARILAGEWWRLGTGHFAHFGLSHLGWNLAVLLPAGIWAERVAPARTRGLFALAPAAIGGSLLLFDPSLAHYAGLSGLVSGVITLLALSRLATEKTDRWFWWSVLALVGLKIVVEWLTAQAVFARWGDAEIRTVPLAHAAGAVCAVIAHRLRRPTAQQS